jgi:cytochrome c553
VQIRDAALHFHLFVMNGRGKLFLTMVKKKRCAGGHWVALDDFPNTSSSKDGKYSWCRKCHSERGKKWYKKNATKRKAQVKAYRDSRLLESRTRERNYGYRQKLAALIQYGGDPPTCKCCGESIVAFLTIDHKDGGGNAHRRSLNGLGGRNFYVWLRKQGWPKGYQVLCFNCNVGTGLHGECPHVLERQARS